jgi:hypothetical protein
MSTLRKLCFAAVFTSLVTYGGGAWADDQAAPGGGPPPPAAGGEGGIVLPVSYVERGITNPQGILSPVGDFGIGRAALLPGSPLGVPPAIGGVAGAFTPPLSVQLTLGAGYAITDDFGVRASVLAMSFNPTVQYFGPSIGATYRFVKGDFEVGAALDVGFSTISGAGGVALTPGLPMHVHFGKTARLDITPEIPISTPGAVSVGIAIPVQFAYDIMEPLHVGVVTGYAMNFNKPGGETIGDSVAIPLGFIAGYAIAGPKGPVLDLDPFFVWPGLFTPGITGSAIGSGAYDFGIEATYYLYL